MMEQTEGNVPVDVTRVPKRRSGVGLGAEFGVGFGVTFGSGLGAWLGFGRGFCGGLGLEPAPLVREGLGLGLEGRGGDRGG